MTPYFEALWGATGYGRGRGSQSFPKAIGSIIKKKILSVILAKISRLKIRPPIPNSRPESREWNLPLAFPFAKMGMEFSICIPVPVNGNEIFLGFPGNSQEFSVPESREWNFLFICIPVPENGNGICHSHSHSRSRKWEWNLPFPVPEVQKSFPLMAANGR